MTPGQPGLAPRARPAIPGSVTINHTPGSSITIDYNGRTILMLDRPVCTVAAWLSSYKNCHLLDDIARMVGLDADVCGVPEHRKGLDQPGLLLGWGVRHEEVRKVADHVFESYLVLHLTAGKRTGPHSCTYVGTDTRLLNMRLVCDWSRP